jgi:flagellar motor switch protein FliM
VSQLLSKDEVDALLKGVADGGLGASPGAGTPEKVVALDLTNRERSVRGRWPGLELVLDRLGRALRTSLGTLLGRAPAVTVAGVELLRFAAVRERLPKPTVLQVFRMTPLRGQGFLAPSPGLAGLVLEVFLGGNAGRRTPLAERELSAIETRVLERLGRRVLHDLGEAWRAVSAVTFDLVRTEQNPALVTIAPPQELVLEIDVAITPEGGEPATLAICVPNASLDPVRAALEALPGSERIAPATVWSERLRALLDDTDLEVSAELGNARLRVSEMLALRAGDLLTLGTGREGPVLVRVEGRPLFHGAPGVAGSSNAVRITGRL